MGSSCWECWLSNPLTRIDDRFSTRSADIGLGGELSFGNFFSGKDAGVFGGVSHGLEKFPLTLMIEYNPDQYDWDSQRGVDRPKSPWSAGLTWHALPGVDLRLSLQHGDEVGVGFRSYLDSKAEPPRRQSDQFISSYYLSQSDLPPQINKDKWYDRLLFDVERSGLILVEGTLSSDANKAKLVVGNASYALWSDALASTYGPRGFAPSCNR